MFQYFISAGNIPTKELIDELIYRGVFAEIRKNVYELVEVSSPYKDGNLTIEQVAKRMGKQPQFVRIGLQKGVLPFGKAVKMGSKYTYHISPKLFAEYIGEIY